MKFRSVSANPAEQRQTRPKDSRFQRASAASPLPPPLPVPFYARMEEAARETTDERRRYDDEAFSLSASAFCVASAGKTNPSEKTWDDNQGQSEDMKRNIRCVYVSKM